MKRVAILLMAAMLAACQSGPGPEAAGKLKVVATFSILADLVQNVGGDKVDVHVLVPAGQDTHTFNPRPADGVAVADAAVMFQNGLGFEPWLDGLYESAGSRATRVSVTAGITPLSMAPGEHGDQAGGSDPHAWHDVRNAERMVANIRDALIAADAPNAAAYQANAETYLAQLKALDEWIVAQVATLPAERRKLVTTHDTFSYFARRYGFTVLGSALGSLSTEAADPSAGQIAKLVQEIKAAGVPAIFAENVHNPQLMQQIASEAGVQLAPPLYTDALGAPGGEAGTYEKMERYNVATIVAALK